jgi:hypothetical protein
MDTTAGPSGPGDGASHAGRGPDGLTGWLITWPATTVLNVIYAQLIEHANTEQIEEINTALDKDTSGGSADDFADVLERAIASEQS